MRIVLSREKGGSINSEQEIMKYYRKNKNGMSEM